MPQTQDLLKGRLSENYCHDLRELLAHYEVTIVSCVYWRNRAPWELETRRCFDSFFLFPVRGNLRLTVDGRRMLVAPGEYLALPDGKEHALVLEKGHKHLEQIALHCHIQDRWRRPLLARFRNPVARLDDAARWHRVLADFASMMSADPELGRHWGRTLVLELMAGRLQEEKRLAPLDREGDPRIGQILQRMKEELGSPELSVESLAAGVGLTATQVRKLFRRETGQSPKQYLHSQRLEKAVHLLRHTTQSIKQIALECGFATDNYFHLVFRAAFGVTPGDFRGREML
ncbi:MAG: AraC family transcriptional regulator [Chthoniobacteraceae bacterium]